MCTSNNNFFSYVILGIMYTLQIVHLDCIYDNK